jgi:hypothetical protein
MTERALGSNFKWFVANVVNRGDGKEGDKDKTESGRVQIRIVGKHDDKKNIPDSKLPWAVPMSPIGGLFSGAGRGGTGTTPVGLKKDSVVIGYYADHDESIPVIFGLLHRAGTDGGNDGETTNPDGNDLPKGARTAATKGKDENDVTKKRLTEDLGKKDQLHLNIPTVGNLHFDGGKILDAINKVDPSNLSGAIPGALSAIKSMTNTLAVAGSLMSNFQKLASGKLGLGDVMSLANKAAGLVNSAQNIAAAAHQISSIAGSIPSTPQAQIAKALTLVNTGKYAVSDPVGFAAQLATNPSLALSVVQKAVATEQMLANAFSGANPLAGIVGALGGLDGLKKLAGGAQGLLGPLTGTFGAATAIAGMMKGSAGAAFAGLKPPPIPKIPGLQIPNIQIPNISNILGVTNSLSNIASVAANITGGLPISGALGTIANDLRAVSSIASSLNNSILQVSGAVSISGFNGLSLNNPGVYTGITSSLAPIQIITPPTSLSIPPTIINNVNITSKNYNINSLINSSIQVAIPAGIAINTLQNIINQNSGVSYNITGTIYKV